MISVRRLVASDMYGLKGSLLRRRIIWAEFIIGCIFLIAIGLRIITATRNLESTCMGYWIIGIGLNYAALFATAQKLSPPGALETELYNRNVRHELQRASIHQLWIIVPLALVVAATIERHQRPRP